MKSSLHAGKGRSRVSGRSASAACACSLTLIASLAGCRSPDLVLVAGTRAEVAGLGSEVAAMGSAAKVGITPAERQAAHDAALRGDAATVDAITARGLRTAAEIARIDSAVARALADSAKAQANVERCSK